LALAAGSVAALAQSVISARSGLIHYVEGQVYLGDQAVESKFGNFPEVKENGQLRTEEGRAEVLLTPGVFLRLGENSSFRMITNRLIDTRVDFLSGAAIVEAEDIAKDNSITVVYKDATVHVLKKGLYRFDSSPGELRVFAGEAEVTADDKTIEVKEGHLVALDTLAISRFDKDATDALNRWSERRAEYVSMANVSAANSLRSSLYSGGMYSGGVYGGAMFDSGWYWNPFYGMFTFVPGFGFGDGWYSPYGFRFWSPFDVDMAYMPGFYYWPYSYGPGYAGTYNTVITRSVPMPGWLHRGAGAGGAVGRGLSSGSAESSSSGSLSSSSTTSSARGGFSASAGSSTSHGGGGSGGGGSHH
jgi:hypothetical protein